MSSLLATANISLPLVVSIEIRGRKASFHVALKLPAFLRLAIRLFSRRIIFERS